MFIRTISFLSKTTRPSFTPYRYTPLKSFHLTTNCLDFKIDNPSNKINKPSNKIDNPKKNSDKDDDPYDGDLLGLNAIPDTFIKILKITVVGVSMLLIIKLFINDKKNRKFEENQEIKPGFPTEPSKLERKSEYEGAGSSYMSRKSGDKLVK